MKKDNTDCNHIMMRNFQMTTFEEAGSFPEIKIETTLMFPQIGKQISNIDLDALKKAIIEAVYYQTVTLKEPQKTKEEFNN